MVKTTNYSVNNNILINTSNKSKGTSDVLQIIAKTTQVAHNNTQGSSKLHAFSKILTISSKITQNGYLLSCVLWNFNYRIRGTSWIHTWTFQRITTYLMERTPDCGILQKWKGSTDTKSMVMKGLY